MTLRTYVSRLRKRAPPGPALHSRAAATLLEPRPRQWTWRGSRALSATPRQRRQAAGATGDQLSVRHSAVAWRAVRGRDPDAALSIESERLTDLRVHALELRVESELALGEGDASLIEELESLVATQPYRDDCGRCHDGAVPRGPPGGRSRRVPPCSAHAARPARRRSGRGSPEGQGQILRHEVPAGAPAEERDNLPAPLTSFIGRRAELDEMVKLLDEHRLVTLTGVGGVARRAPRSRRHASRSSRRRTASNSSISRRLRIRSAVPTGDRARP